MCPSIIYPSIYLDTDMHMQALGCPHGVRVVGVHAWKHTPCPSVVCVCSDVRAFIKCRYLCLVLLVIASVVGDRAPMQVDHHAPIHTLDLVRKATKCVSGLHLPPCKKLERSQSPPLLLAKLENIAEQKVGDKTQEKKVEDRSARMEEKKDAGRRRRDANGGLRRQRLSWVPSPTASAYTFCCRLTPRRWRHRAATCC